MTALHPNHHLEDPPGLSDERDQLRSKISNKGAGEPEGMTDNESPLIANILEGLNWRAVEEAVGREQSNREKFTPTISVFRWWARRPHSLMGAIIDAARAADPDPKFRLSDPFSGGGTVAIEAARRGIPAYAQDLYPWPITGLATSLTPVKLIEFDLAAAALQQHLEPFAARYRREDGKMLSHIMKVRVCSCPSCHEDLYLFPGFCQVKFG